MSDPVRWGLPAKAVDRLGTDLHTFWERYHGCFRTRTRDTSENALLYWRGQLTMEDARNFANIERRLQGGDGQALQQFMSDSPWEAQGVYQQIQADVRAHPALQVGGALIVDECAEEKAGDHSAGAGRQHNGRLGKNEMSQVVTSLVFAHLATGTWILVGIVLARGGVHGGRGRAPAGSWRARHAHLCHKTRIGVADDPPGAGAGLALRVCGGR